MNTFLHLFASYLSSPSYDISIKFLIPLHPYNLSPIYTCSLRTALDIPIISLKYFLSLYFLSGVRNGMFLGTARKLCPNLKVVSYDFPLYEELSEKVTANWMALNILKFVPEYLHSAQYDTASLFSLSNISCYVSHLRYQIYEILYQSSGATKVEPVSVDEAYLEFFFPSSSSSSSTSSHSGQKHAHSSDESFLSAQSPSQFGMSKAKELREMIFKTTGCSARWGKTCKFEHD